jgi:glycosyltransferase involved in cell wall biosynthesis
LDISSRIRWHGVVPNAAALFPAFDAWILSSRTEGTPIALLEAMAAGVPAVVTAVGGVPDVVSAREATLVAPDDAGALAQAVEAVLADPAGARRRAEAARERLRAEFDPDQWLEAHVERYRALLAPTPSEA